VSGKNCAIVTRLKSTGITTYIVKLTQLFAIPLPPGAGKIHPGPGGSGKKVGPQIRNRNFAENQYIKELNEEYNPKFLFDTPHCPLNKLKAVKYGVHIPGLFFSIVYFTARCSYGIPCSYTVFRRLYVPAVRNP
jgi:hypothetical protein